MSFSCPPTRPATPTALILGLAFVLASASTSRACSVCGCSLSSDWAAQGYAVTRGLDASVRFEYFDQTDLRSGTSSIDRATLTFPNDNEIQQRTLNRNTWLDLNYVVNASWAVTASIPYHDRFHTTIVDGDTNISTSRASGPGDVRLLVRYQMYRETSHSWSVQFGLKLATGGFNQNFAEGPQVGERLDRGLQLGTGTTNLILGASWFARPAVNLGAFVQATFEQPLAARADFLPSTSLNLSSGIRWLNPSRFTPQLQLNLKTETREHGTEADTNNSGGALVYLSPGVTAELTAHTNAFVFVQLPVYQRVNGLQLEPNWLLSVGVRWKL